LLRDLGGRRVEVQFSAERIPTLEACFSGRWSSRYTSGRAGRTGLPKTFLFKL
jgi:hypothetical protein